MAECSHPPLSLLLWPSTPFPIKLYGGRTNGHIHCVIRSIEQASTLNRGHAQNLDRRTERQTDTERCFGQLAVLGATNKIRSVDPKECPRSGDPRRSGRETQAKLNPTDCQTPCGLVHSGGFRLSGAVWDWETPRGRCVAPTSPLPAKTARHILG